MIRRVARVIEHYWWGIGFLVVALPLLPMANLGASFDGDWYTHLWFARYFSSYLHFHHELPLTINSTQIVGMPLNLFYAAILNPVLGLIGVFFGPQGATRVLVFGASALEFFLAYKLVAELTKDRLLPFVVSILMVWAIYPYTVIFTEAAIPEFFATTLVACGFCAWFLPILRKSKKDKIKYFLLCALALCLAAGSHPITAFYAAVFLSIVFISSLSVKDLSQKRTDLIRAMGLGLILLIFLSPWIYANLSFMNRLSIAKNPGLTFYPMDADAWWTRFQLLPFDKRSLLKGQMVDTCYLDTQINMPLLILTAGLVWILRREKKAVWQKRLIILGSVLFLLTSWMSLSLLPFEFLPKVFKVVQFGWRLITYQNLSILLVLIASLLSFDKINGSRIQPKNILVAVCLTISFLGMFERVTHSMGARNPIPREGYSRNSSLTSDFTSMSSSFIYLMDAYTDEGIETIQENQILQNISFDVGQSGQSFGLVQEKNLEVQISGWYQTNVAAFGWNKILLDGKQLESYKRQGRFLCVYLDKGSHQLMTSLEMPQTFILLRQFSFAILGMVLISLVMTQISRKS